MTALIFYNPNCGTSRNTLDIMQASGDLPNIIEYLKTSPTLNYLVKLLTAMTLYVSAHSLGSWLKKRAACCVGTVE